MKSRSEATITDLYQLPENAKAEIVNGEVVLMSPTGGIPGRAGGKIYRSLDDYEQQTGNGYAFPDNVGFTVNLPTRKSFSPDAAFHPGPCKADIFLLVRRSSLPRYAASMTMARLPRRRSPQNAPIISPPGHWSSGMLMYCATWLYASIGPMLQTIRPSTAVAILPRPSRPYPAGGYRLMLSCPDEHAL